MDLLTLLVGDEDDDRAARRRRTDVVAANTAIFRAHDGGNPHPHLPVLKAVELAVRAKSPRVANNADIVSVLSAFADHSPHWTLIQAADAGHWRLVQRILLRDNFDAVDPFYRQWVYTKAMARAAATGRLDMVQLLTSRFPGCFVTVAVQKAAEKGHLEILQWLHEHHDNVKWGADELGSGSTQACRWRRTASFPSAPPSRAGTSRWSSGRCLSIRWRNARR